MIPLFLVPMALLAHLAVVDRYFMHRGGNGLSNSDDRVRWVG